MIRVNIHRSKVWLSVSYKYNWIVQCFVSKWYCGEVALREFLFLFYWFLSISRINIANESLSSTLKRLPSCARVVETPGRKVRGRSAGTWWSTGTECRLTVRNDENFHECYKVYWVSGIVHGYWLKYYDRVSPCGLSLSAIDTEAETCFGAARVSRR